MIQQASLIRAVFVLLALMLSLQVKAFPSYFLWETKTLDPSTGASCSDGSPYRFFVNRTPFTSKTVIIYEGGGACWDQETCKGGNLLAAANPEGIPANYMADLKNLITTPFNTRVHPFSEIQTQRWNMVFMPYCTGDVHTGNKTVVYDDEDPANPLVFRHKGSLNTEAVVEWMQDNMPRPRKLLLTGYSAGGAGSTSNYAVVRNGLNPREAALLADSGPLYPAPRSGSSSEYPSLPLHNKIRVSWGLDEPEGLLTKMFARYPGLINPDNLGSAATGLAKAFPNDRFGYTLFQTDGNYSDFSYSRFYPEFDGASEEEKAQYLNQRWRKDIGHWVTDLNQESNIGYYLPNGRDILQAHCTTIVTFGGTAIREDNLKSVKVFANNLIDGRGTPIRSVDTSDVIQKSFGFLSPLIAPLVNDIQNGDSSDEEE